MKSALLGIFFSLPALAASPIDFKAPMIYPEGIAYDPGSQTFFVSSMHYGKIGKVSADGKYRVFLAHPSLVSTVGLHADPALNRLIACVSDPGVSEKTSNKTQKKMARLFISELSRPKMIKIIELDRLTDGGQHFCNDIAVDPKDSSIYVTDSFTPLIYKIDSQYKPSIFVKAGDMNSDGFNFNGIVVHPDGYLLVAQYTLGNLVKISLADPSQRKIVKIGASFPGADGLILNSAEEIWMIQNSGKNVVRKIISNDGWKTAKLADTSKIPLNFPTTGVKTDQGIFVLEAKLGEIFSDVKAAQSQVFSIKPVDFN